MKVYEFVDAEQNSPETVSQLSPESSEAERLKALFNTPVPRVVVRWERLPLGDALESMLVPSKRGRALREGIPAYLAYAALGALLDVSPERIKNALDNFRYPRARKPQP